MQLSLLYTKGCVLAAVWWAFCNRRQRLRALAGSGGGGAVERDASSKKSQ